MTINQTPEALAEEIKRLDRLGLEWHEELNRLRDMAASGAKECAALQRDAEHYQWLREKARGPVPLVRVLIMERGQYVHHVDFDAAIAATKRGGA